ncbi:MAG: glycosyltransferase [Magnetococcus sp. YQC-9]
MEERPLVSVIINCYNGEAYLRAALESVIRQTYTHWEILFWDNQSTDSSRSIVDACQDSRINYFYAPTHTLLYDARNQAIVHAKGELLAFLDVDDWWEPKKLEKQVALFADEKVALVYANYWIVLEKKQSCRVAYPRQLPEGPVALDELLRSYPVGMLTLMIRRSLVSEMDGPFDPRYHIIGDFDLVIRLASRHPIACVQEPLASYRIHGSNESITKRETTVAELELWESEMARDPIIGKNRFFGTVRSTIQYFRSVNDLLGNQRIKAFKGAFNLPFGKLKIRLLGACFLPLFLIRLLRVK